MTRWSAVTRPRQPLRARPRLALHGWRRRPQPVRTPPAGTLLTAVAPATLHSARLSSESDPGRGPDDPQGPRKDDPTGLQATPFGRSNPSVKGSTDKENPRDQGVSGFKPDTYGGGGGI